MFSTALIVFRETLEIAMILGIVLMSTRGLPGRAGWIAGGFAGGIGGAALVAVFTEAIAGALSGAGQELFNAGILFAAAITIGWTVLWMRRHGREMSLKLKQTGHDIATGTLPFYSLSVIICLAVLREGSEIVLFLYGMMLSGQGIAAIAGGATTGLMLGAGAGAMLYRGLLKVPARHALKVTSWLLVLLVAGLAAQGAGYLSAAGWFMEWSQPVWDTSWLLSESGMLGKTLHGLIGYTARPSQLQLAFYGGTLAFILALMSLGERRGRTLVTQPA